MTGAECNLDCGENSESDDDEAREPLNQVIIFIYSSDKPLINLL